MKNIVSYRHFGKIWGTITCLFQPLAIAFSIVIFSRHKLIAIFAGSCALMLGISQAVVLADETAPKGLEKNVSSRLTPALCHQIDQYFAKQFRLLPMVGYAFAVVDHGQVVYEKCFGDADKNTAVTPSTIFGLASITKTFTSLVLLSLVDQGKIDLDARINKYLPDAPASWKQITVRQLASMTGGFARDLDNEVPWRDQGYAQAKAMTLLSSPGSTFLYSNVSYRLLGQIIEGITGKRLLQSIRELVLSPASMNSTGVVTELRSTGKLAEPFGGQNGEFQKLSYRNPAVNFASGNLFSTIDDMTKYANALLQGSFVSRKAYRTMWFDRPALTTGKPDYWAFGWGAKAIVQGESPRKVSMNGSLPGICSTIILYPDAQLGIVALSNFRSKEIAQLPQQVGRIIFPEDKNQHGGSAELESESHGTESEGRGTESEGHGMESEGHGTESESHAAN